MKVLGHMVLATMAHYHPDNTVQENRNHSLMLRGGLPFLHIVESDFSDSVTTYPNMSPHQEDFTDEDDPNFQKYRMMMDSVVGVSHTRLHWNAHSDNPLLQPDFWIYEDGGWTTYLFGTTPILSVSPEDKRKLVWDVTTLESLRIRGIYDYEWPE